MRLFGNTSRQEILAALEQSARQSWGAERARALQPILDRVATSIITVLREPLDEPLVGPDPSIPWRAHAGER